ncbi:hypothetical protein CEN45_19170 [Fischerella thermalis CCMEE 5198]|uniref:nSTAND1 domain-containing NTPase n=1 Tax=Fischerella thermalis TaxID=372787 RepID=UPI000C80FB66|nr:CHAT domain-containing protein [Fischerella thermalis]PMB19415.1 hypothetical protein CEN45_19170 [Fischerella thermalis CCMEE 5198]
MSQLFVLKLEGDFEQGFKATLEIGEEGDVRPTSETIGELFSNPEIPKLYKDWQLSQRECLRRGRIKVPASQTTQVSIAPLIQDCQEKAEILHHKLNSWLNNSESFRPIRDKWLANFRSSEEVRLLIRLRNQDPSKLVDLLRIPWQLWDLVEEYSIGEVALSNPQSEKQVKKKIPTIQDQVRILAILGNSQGINSEKDLEFLNQLSRVELTVLKQPERHQINDQLWEQPWDILFFAGHSETDGELGRIEINQKTPPDTLTIADLKYGLKKAVQHGLQLAIFNSCDGLGLAHQLEDLHIPQVIVMREPVEDKVAQEFLQHFLTAFTGGQSLYMAVREARQRLHGLEDKYPCASWMPVICQNAGAVPPKWLDLGRRSTDIHPYRGLFAFQEKHAQFFFGREAFTQQLVKAVQTEPLVTVIGPSGSGKSSVVFAGLIPQLRSQQNWCIASFRPGDRPFHALASALISQLEPDLQNNNDRLRETRKLAKDLRHETGALQDAIGAIASKVPNTRMLLVADQFEELYTLCEPEQRQCFLERLLEVVNAGNRHVINFTLVLTFRADFLERALSEHCFADFMCYSNLMLGPMNRNEMEEAIAKPAALLGVTIEEGLTQRLLDDVGTEPGRLPLLQFALTQLWDRQSNASLTNANYDGVGGVKEALAQYAEEVYNKLNHKDKEKAKQIFIQLVHPGEGTADTRRLATRNEVGEENWDLVTHLANQRLVITNTHLLINSDSKLVEEETVEIVHEALIGGWFRLQTWLDLDRDFRTWQERLRNSMREWKRSQQDEEALLRGVVPLAEAEDWLKKRPQEISRDGQDFILRSIQVRDRKRRRTIYGLTSFSAFALIIAGVAGFFAIAQANEKVNAQIALAESQFASNQRLDALRQGIKAVRELQKLPFVYKNTQTRVAATLPNLVYGVRERNRFDGHNKKVEGVSFSPDGQFIASASEDQTIKLWNQNGLLLTSLSGHKNWVNKLSFSPDGKLLATASSDTTVKLWRLECISREDSSCVQVKGTLLKTLTGHQGWVTDVIFSPDGKSFVTSSRDGTVKIWSQDGVLQKTIPEQKNLPEKNNSSENNPVWGVGFSPNGEIIATANEDNTIKLFSREGILLQTLKGHKNRVRDVSFSPDGQRIVSGSDDGTAIIWQRDGTAFKSLPKPLEGHKGNVNRVVFSPDSKTLATVSDGDDDNVKLWNIDGTLLTTFNGHTDRVKDVSFNPDGRTLVTGSWDSSVRVWNLVGLFSKTLEGHTDRVMDVSFSPDGQMFASASWDKTVRLWRRDGTFIKLLPHTDKVNGVSFSPDGQLIATTSAEKDQTVQLWSRDGTFLKPLRGHTDYIRAVAWSPDSQILVTVGGEKDRTVKLWSRDGQLLYTLKGHKDGVYGVNFSPNGKMFATSSKDNTVKLWSRDGQLLNTLKGHTGWVWNVSFSPDSQLIASASEDNTVKLWRRDGTFLKTLEGHTARVSDVTFRVSDVAFSSDSQLIVTGSSDATLKFWNRDGQLLTTLEEHKDRVMSVSFSPDGQTLASTSVDGAVKLWSFKDLKLTSDQNVLLNKGCDLIHDYLKTNQKVEKSDRTLCD